MEYVNGVVDNIVLLFMHISLIKTKIKNITYTDDELDEEQITTVQIPLRKPLVFVQIRYEVKGLKVGSTYTDNNGHIYRAVSDTILEGVKIVVEYYDLPSKFVLMYKPYSEV